MLLEFRHGMEIAFKDEKLRKLCENSQWALRHLGADCARKLRTRLSDLEAAEHVRELVAGRPHPLEGDRDGQFALDLAKGSRLVFEPNHDPCPCLETEAIDWSRVTRIRIVLIGDYHD